MGEGAGSLQLSSKQNKPPCIKNSIERIIIVANSTCFAYRDSNKLWTPGSSLPKRWTQNSKYFMTSWVSFLHYERAASKIV